ncbi:hypothetical protein [Methylobacillus flagellatus]|uniref:hypothetical protein n=1 Tax=Methylobacillus flagellatus TaxID=405 RepID=UPI0003184C90|nr:hypothetical protein [Methylobacillus flagellatus]
MKYLFFGGPFNDHIFDLPEPLAVMNLSLNNETYPYVSKNFFYDGKEYLIYVSHDAVHPQEYETEVARLIALHSIPAL